LRRSLAGGSLARVLRRTPAIVLAVFAAIAAPSSPAAPVDPYDSAAANVVCPTAPTGWFNPTGAGGRFVLTPLDVAGNDGEYGGSDVEEVDCGYFTSAGKHLIVTVRYALPRDVNPFADFNVGCTVNDLAAGVPTGAYGWNTTDRVYRIVSEQRWDYATFHDYFGALVPADVARFESIARSLLHASEPNAHNCGVTDLGQAVALRENWLFGFDVTANANGGVTHATGQGTFAIRENPDGGTGTLVDLQAQPLAITVTAKGSRPKTVTIRVLAPRDFRTKSGATFLARVAVTASTFPACRVGAAGTLSVSTETETVRLDVCGRRLLDADGNVTLENL
jgi:hypothetical protein